MSLVARGSRRSWSERKASRPGGEAEVKTKRERGIIRKRGVRVLDMTGGGRDWSGKRVEIGAAIGSGREKGTGPGNGGKSCAWNRFDIFIGL